MVSLTKTGEESFSMFKQSVNDDNDTVVDNNEEIDDVDKLFVKRKLKNLKNENQAFIDEMTRFGSDQETISKMLAADEYLQKPRKMTHMTTEFNQFDIYDAGNPCPYVPSICDILPENKFTKILSVKRERLENEIKTLITTLEERSEKLQQAMAIREQEILSQNPVHESTLVTCKQIQKLEYELAQIRSEACEINPAEGANIKPFCCKLEIKKVIKLQRKVDKLQNLALLKACDLKVLDEAKNRVKIDISNLNDDIKSATKIIDDYEKELQDISHDIQNVINSEYTKQPKGERAEEDIPFSHGLSDWSIDDLPPEGKKSPRLPHKKQPPNKHSPKEQPPINDGSRHYPKKPTKPLEVKPKIPARRCPPSQVPKKKVGPVHPPEKRIPEKRPLSKPKSTPTDKYTPPCKRNDSNKIPRKNPPPKYSDKVRPVKPKQPETEIPPSKNPKLPPVEFPPQPFNPNESQIEPAEVEAEEESSSSSYLKELYESTPHAESSNNIMHISKTADISGSTQNPNTIKHTDNISIDHGGIGKSTDLHTESTNVEAAVENEEESSGQKCDSTGSEIFQLDENNIAGRNTYNSDIGANVSLQPQEKYGTEANGNDVISNYNNHGAVEDCFSEATTIKDHNCPSENHQGNATGDESNASAVTIKCCCNCASKKQATDSMINFVEKLEGSDRVNVEDPSSSEPQSQQYHTNEAADADRKNGICKNSSEHLANVDEGKFVGKANENLPPSTTSELETDEQSSKTTSLDVKEFNDKTDDPDDPARKNRSRKNDDQRHQKYTRSPRNSYRNSNGSPRGSNEQRHSSQKKSSNYHKTIREAENLPHKCRENDRPSTIHEKRKSRMPPNELKFEKVTKKRSLCSFANKTLEKSNTVLLNISSRNNRKAYSQSSHYVRVQRPTKTKQTQTTPMRIVRSTTKKYTEKGGEVLIKVEETALKKNQLTTNSSVKKTPRDKIQSPNIYEAGYDSIKVHSNAKYLEEKLQHYRHLYSALKEENRDLSKQFVASQIDLGKYKENYEKLQLDSRKAENLADEIVKLRQTNAELQKQITEIVCQLNRKEFENRSLIIENERFQSAHGQKLAPTDSTVENINYIQRISRLEQQIVCLNDQNQTVLRSYEESQKLLQQAEQKLNTINEGLRKPPKDNIVLAHPSGDATHKDWLNYSKIMTERFNETKHKLDTTNFLLTITEEERDELKKENSEIKSMLQKNENKINQLLTDRNSPSLQSQVAFLSEEYEKQATLTKQLEEQVKQLSKGKLEATEKLQKAELKLVDYRETLDSLRTYKEDIMKITSPDRVEHSGRTKRGQPDSVINSTIGDSWDSNLSKHFSPIASRKRNKSIHDEVATAKTRSSTNPKSCTSKALSSVLKRYCKGLPRITSSRHGSSYSRSKSINALTTATKMNNEPSDFWLVYSFLHQQISKNLRKIRNKAESKSIRQELNDIRHSLEWSRRKVQDMSTQSQTIQNTPMSIENPSCSLLRNIFEKIMLQGTNSLNPKEILYLHRVVYKAGVECSKNSKNKRTSRAAGSFDNEKVIDSESNISITKRILEHY